MLVTTQSLHLSCKLLNFGKD